MNAYPLPSMTIGTADLALCDGFATVWSKANAERGHQPREAAS